MLAKPIRRICVDPGHGGSDPGAVGLVPHTLRESDFNLSVSLLVAGKLKELGFKAQLTRKDDRYVSLTERAEMANGWECDFFVSIHANAAASPKVQGIESFFFPGSEVGEIFAGAILSHLWERFPGHAMRGRKTANFTVLRKTAMPAVLVECEFLTNPNQLEFLSSKWNQWQIANAIAEAIASTSRDLDEP